MKTPICDFLSAYEKSNAVRFHMPGHKGQSVLGFEGSDITEIFGADDLSAPSSIILESEKNATNLFDTAHSFYVTGGSSQSIKAMVYLAKLMSNSKSNTILAGRNSHKAFLHALALLDLDVDWLYPEEDTGVNSICSCVITVENLDKILDEYDEKPMAVFITSPDYLGGMSDISALSAVCKKHKVPLIVDNAHGAYLKFLKDDMHPISLGADLVCDSAHKTLPVITGGAYLHVSKNADKSFLEYARRALSYFGSSSPSYLILKSLDMANKILDYSFKDKLIKTIEKIDEAKKIFSEKGMKILESDPLKLTIDCKSAGYYPEEINEIFLNNNIHIEYMDRDFIVLMLSPFNKDEDFIALKECFKNFVVRDKIIDVKPKLYKSTKQMSFKDTMFSLSKTVKVEYAIGKICASSVVSCPPAIPIAVSGEVITKEIVELLKIYDKECIDIIDTGTI